MYEAAVIKIIKFISRWQLNNLCWRCMFVLLGDGVRCLFERNQNKKKLFPELLCMLHIMSVFVWTLDTTETPSSGQGVSREIMSPLITHSICTSTC